MESLLRDLGDARDACNNLPFDDALRDKIATELDRIEAAPPLERMLVTKPPVKRWAELATLACATMLVEYEACQARIEAKGSGSCEGQYGDWVHCVDACAAKSLFSKLK
ncbi:hypothetical protein EMIHUDRAFT_94940 [Emiliania huxleyi CCMP1516]|uniref:Ubiquinol-cytochrome C reductase hinge domain-containing protein n=2 Tax=Emiliania huxleyi TaxID=2903 RepID=A0A0D3L119_EMIH1|nr:hypothetical protein EMIHUDRAFT_94940 [Emiliania huxleyi CCMP1516]EOD41704.1 hypothetical protein EMIHUDRAFT_94940 [Emiliania huxleyi CCMP1516]|eukprot:XP_005794133.1 hypothetical protein EMIHUDRAFT_94940 [Emiliania huxleyi CCMP1516]